MKKADVVLGGKYIAKVSGKLAVVRVDTECHHGGWWGVNVKTGRSIRIRSAQRLRAPAGGKYVITCNGRYVDGESSWVTTRGSAKRFGSIVDACEFFNQMAHHSIDTDPGAKIIEVAF